MQFVAAFMALSVALTGGQTGAPTASAHPDVSGYWELRYDSLSVPAPSLTAKAAADQPNQRRGDIQAVRSCINVGVPALMEDRAALDIRQSPTVIGIVAKSPSSVRYIYTDGRMHPEKDEADPTTNGHSIGHWEGDTLVVDTVGFNDRGVRSIPGGGVRTSNSHLTERYRLLDGVNDCRSLSRGTTRSFFKNRIHMSSGITKSGRLANPVSTTAILMMRSEQNSYWKGRTTCIRDVNSEKKRSLRWPFQQSQQPGYWVQQLILRCGA